MNWWTHSRWGARLEHSTDFLSTMGGHKWEAEEWLSSVLGGIKRAQPAAESCREHGIVEPQYCQWRGGFISGGRRALTDGVPATEDAP